MATFPVQFVNHTAVLYCIAAPLLAECCFPCPASFERASLPVVEGQLRLQLSNILWKCHFLDCFSTLCIGSWLFCLFCIGSWGEVNCSQDCSLSFRYFFKFKHFWGRGKVLSETSSQNVNELSEKANVGEPLVAQYRIYKENKLLLFSLKVWCQFLQDKNLS